MARLTITFECVSNISEEDLEYQIYIESQKRRKTICEKENAAIGDIYWSQYNIFDSDNHATVVLSFRTRSDFDDMTIKDLEEELEELQEDLEEAEGEYEDIEDLDEDQYDDYDFDSEDEYKERLRELEIDIFLLKSDIELIEKMLEKELSEAPKDAEKNTQGIAKCAENIMDLFLNDGKGSN